MHESATFEANGDMLSHIQQLSPGRGTFDYLHGCGTSWASSDVVQIKRGIKMSGSQEMLGSRLRRSKNG